MKLVKILHSPETYNIYSYDDNYIGYCKLQNGIFTVVHNNKIIYKDYTADSDEFKFEEDRNYYLNLACQGVPYEIK